MGNVAVIYAHGPMKAVADAVRAHPDVTDELRNEIGALTFRAGDDAVFVLDQVFGAVCLVVDAADADAVAVDLLAYLAEALTVRLERMDAETGDLAEERAVQD